MIVEHITGDKYEIRLAFGGYLAEFLECGETRLADSIAALSSNLVIRKPK